MAGTLEAVVEDTRTRTQATAEVAGALGTQRSREPTQRDMATSRSERIDYSSCSPDTVVAKHFLLLKAGPRQAHLKLLSRRIALSKVSRKHPHTSASTPCCPLSPSSTSCSSPASRTAHATACGQTSIGSGENGLILNLGHSRGVCKRFPDQKMITAVKLSSRPKPFICCVK